MVSHRIICDIGLRTKNTKQVYIKEQIKPPCHEKKTPVQIGWDTPDQS